MPPTLDLDDRQRAMLREMGVQVWQPRVQAAPPAMAPEAPSAAVLAPVPAPTPTPTPSQGPVDAPANAVAAVRQPVPARPAVTTAPAGTAPVAVLRGEWQAVFPPEGDDPQSPIWLVLVDGPSADPREGDAGRLLSAMLRAAGLHKGARVWAGSVGRAGDEGEPLADALRQALAAHRPAMVLTLGRLASQAVLATAAPLGKLRGQVFSVGQVDPVPLVASYEPGWLLRSQDDKARAWEDLCRALSAVRHDPP